MELQSSLAGSRLEMNEQHANVDELDYITSLSWYWWWWFRLCWREGMYIMLCSLSVMHLKICLTKLRNKLTRDSNSIITVLIHTPFSQPKLQTLFLRQDFLSPSDLFYFFIFFFFILRHVMRDVFILGEIPHEETNIGNEWIKINLLLDRVK